MFFLVLRATGPGDNLALLEHSVKTLPSGDRILTVTLHNSANHPYTYAQIEISFIDKDDNIVDNQALKIENLTGGQTWSPEFMITQPEAIKFRIEKLRWRNVENRDFAIGPYKALELETH